VVVLPKRRASQANGRSSDGQHEHQCARTQRRLRPLTRVVGRGRDVERHLPAVHVIAHAERAQLDASASQRDSQLAPLHLPRRLLHHGGQVRWRAGARTSKAVGLSVRQQDLDQQGAAAGPLAVREPDQALAGPIQLARHGPAQLRRQSVVVKLQLRLARPLLPGALAPRAVLAGTADFRYLAELWALVVWRSLRADRLAPGGVVFCERGLQGALVLRALTVGTG